jgi:hypothetical protein
MMAITTSSSIKVKPAGTVDGGVSPKPTWQRRFSGHEAPVLSDRIFVFLETSPSYHKAPNARNAKTNKTFAKNAKTGTGIYNQSRFGIMCP